MLEQHYRDVHTTCPHDMSTATQRVERCQQPAAGEAGAKRRRLHTSRYFPYLREVIASRPPTQRRRELERESEEARRPGGEAPPGGHPAGRSRARSPAVGSAAPAAGCWVVPLRRLKT